MNAAAVPLTWATAITSWTFDGAAACLVVALTIAYAWALRRGGHRARPGPGGVRPRPWCFVAGMVVLVVATFCAVACYAPALFWMRALQVLLLLYVAPFLLAVSAPLTVLGAALPTRWRRRAGRALGSRGARIATHPLATSAAMLATPWLLYLTPWYGAALRSPAIGAATTVALIGIGFGYFYARLQADPVPRRYSPSVSLLISVVESLGDGVLGLVIWLGPLLAGPYYDAVERSWGPSRRTDQTIGAGVLWLLGDLVGMVFVVVLMRLFAADDRVRAAAIDAALDAELDAELVAGLHPEPVAGPDRAEEATPLVAGSPDVATAAPRPGLWWEHDPQLRSRLR